MSEENHGTVRGNVLFYSGEIEDKLNVFLWDNLFGSEGKTLVLCSFGGVCDIMLSILDLFDTIDDLSTLATGACMSAAVPIIAAGTPGKRAATPRTRFMAHPISCDGGSEGDEANIEANLAELRRHREAYVGVLASVTKKSRTWWNAKLRSGKPWYFDAKKALELGIIDEVTDG